MGWKVPALSLVVVAVALAVVGVAVGLLIGGPVGALVGAVPGALAAVVAGFVPAVRDAAERRRAERERLETAAAAARVAWDAVGEPVAAGAPSGPAGWLRADLAVVEFTGREEELAGLRAWCRSEDAGAVRVLVGAGGVGKTRLALQVAAEWAAGGDEWRLVAAGEEAEAMAAARGVTAGPVLLVVDYAETRAGLGKLLRAVLDDRGMVRVLLTIFNGGGYEFR